MGVVIGKGGDNIQRIRDEFHVAIYTVSSAYTELIDLERVLYVIGDETNESLCETYSTEARTKRSGP